MENTRTKNSIFNISSNFIIYFIKAILAFILRTIFIKILGTTYLGVNGLLTNVLSMLSLAELGIGSAISFSLYKPLADKDNKQISALMSFYRRTYNIIGVIVLIIGLILFLFLDKLIVDAGQIENLNIIYLLYLINTVSTYYIAYKEVLITADQKTYKLTKINLIFTVALNFFQAIMLIIFKNFIIYLIAQFFIQIIQKICINRCITKQYVNVDFKSKTRIKEASMKDIKKNVKAMIVHKIGDYCINGTDNLIISSCINVVTVGFYSNYLTLVTMVNSLIIMIYNNITASFGNLLAKDGKNRSVEVFKKIDFISYILYSFSAVVFVAILSPFIKLWIGDEYVLNNLTVILISFSFFLTGTRVAITVVRNSAGAYDKDQYIPIIQSIVNLIISIIGAKTIGLNGVIFGTIISSFIPCIYRTYIVYKTVFEANYVEYFKNTYLKYIMTALVSMISINIIMGLLNVSNIVEMIIGLIVSFLIHGVIVVVIFRKTKEFDYCLQFGKNIYKRVRKKWKKD